MISKWFFSLANENAKNEPIDITHLKFINSELLFTRDLKQYFQEMIAIWVEKYKRLALIARFKYRCSPCYEVIR